MILHVVPAPAVVVDGSAAAAQKAERRARELGSYRDEMAACLRPRDLPAMPFKAERFLAKGDSAEVVLRKAEHGGADLIVMGTHGRPAAFHARRQAWPRRSAARRRPLWSRSRSRLPAPTSRRPGEAHVTV